MQKTNVPQDRKHRITIRRIADACGVSMPTVSRVLHNHPNISPETRCRIEAEIKRAGYRSPRRKRSGLVLLVSSDRPKLINGEYYFHMINAIQRRFLECNCRCIVTDLHSLRTLGCLHLDGIIVIDNSSDLPEKWAREHALPVIMLNRPRMRLTDNSYSLRSDDIDAMEKAVSMLYSHGHRKIGLLLIGTHSWNNEQRRHGFLQAMAKFGLKAQAVIGHAPGSDNLVELGRLVSSGITGLICPAEGSGIGVLHTLWMFKVMVPRDLSFVCWETDGISSNWNPPLSTIGQDFDGFAEYCCRIILDDPALPRGEREFVIPNRVFERDSVKSIL